MDPPADEHVLQALLDHVSHPPLRIGDKHAQWNGRDAMPRFLHANQGIAHLRTIPMRQNHIQSLSNHFHHADETPPRVRKLLVDVPFFELPGDGISPQCHNDPPRMSKSL